MAKAALPYLRAGGALLTMSYLGADALRAQLQHHGPGQGQPGGRRALPGRRAWAAKGIRVNGISAGPIKTLAAAGIKDFGKLLTDCAATTPIRRTITIDDVGNTAAFLLSDLAGGISAEIVYVDGGFSQAMVGGGDETE
jgi:enoyl-[acyl-carrier protein] reductase I